MPSLGEHLFVYGTLTRSATHPMARELARHAEFVGAGHFRGRLYRVADYPGAVASIDPLDVVFGEVFRLRSPDLLQALDRYEGCDAAAAEPTLYVRERRSVTLIDGTELEAWIYLYNRAVAALPRIASGRFMSCE